MRINQPITADQHTQADQDHAELAQRQKAYYRALADKIEAGEPISGSDAMEAGRIIRRAADAISTKRKRPKGQPVQVPDTVRWQYARLVVRDELSSNDAIEQLCELYSTSTEAIKAKLGMVRAKRGWEAAKAETETCIHLEQMATGNPENKT